MKVVFIFLAICFGLFVVGGIITGFREDAKKTREEESYRDIQDSYIIDNNISVTTKIESGINRVLVDEIGGQIYISNSDTKELNEPFVIIPFSAIIGSETLIDGKTETKVSGGLGRAVVGGVLAGGAGAIVVAATGKSVSQDKITSFKTQIYLDDISDPLFVFNLINSTIAVEKNSAEYRKAMEFSNRLNAIIRVIVNRNEAGA